MSRTGKYAVIHYTGKFEDGNVFDSSEGRAPFEFKIGEGMVIPGFEKAVLEMEIDESREIVIPPEEGYGLVNEELVQKVSREEFSTHMTPEAGMSVQLQLQNGQQIPALISDVSDTDVTIDLNHPLAGKTLVFNISLLEINDEPKYSGNCSPDCCNGCDSCG